MLPRNPFQDFAPALVEVSDCVDPRVPSSVPRIKLGGQVWIEADAVAEKVDEIGLHRERSAQGQLRSGAPTGGDVIKKLKEVPPMGVDRIHQSPGRVLQRPPRIKEDDVKLLTSPECGYRSFELGPHVKERIDHRTTSVHHVHDRPYARRRSADAEKLRLAAATLLAVVALGDGRFDTAERAAIERLVRARFGLSADEAGRLIDAAERKAKDETDLLPFTSTIKDNFPHAERVDLIEMLWEVCYASGEPHDYQDSQVRLIAGLIHVSDRDRGAARKHVLERRAAAAEAAGAEKLHLAVATLLAVVALGDGRFNTAERATTERLVRERFGLSEIETGRLIDAAEREARNEIDLVPFTSIIKDNFPHAERVDLIEMLWEVCYASGEPNDYQDSQVRLIAALIHVSDRDRGAARKRVLERRRRAGRPR